MNELAAKIQRAENAEPIVVNQINNRCNFLLKRSHPNDHKPKKVDSKKKATKASTASAGPKISPT